MCVIFQLVFIFIAKSQMPALRILPSLAVDSSSLMMLRPRVYIGRDCQPLLIHNQGMEPFPPD